MPKRSLARYRNRGNETLRFGLFAPGDDPARCEPTVTAVRAGDQISLPGFQWGPAARPDTLLHLVTAGEGELTTSDGRWTLKTGDLVCAFQQQPVEIRTHPERLLRRCWIGFVGSPIAAIVGELGFSRQKPVLALGRQHALLSPLFYALRDELIAKEPGCRWRTAGLLWSVFGLVTKLRSDRAGGDAGRLSPIARALHYIELHYPDIESVEQLAQLVGLSRSHFSTRFRRENGISPQVYLTRTRLEQAARLLGETSTSVKEVASTVGFKDAAYFSRVFHAQYGHPPSAHQSLLSETGAAP